MVATGKTLMNQASKRPTQSPSATRNLQKGDLGGAIFGCKHATKDECLAKQLFGLPSSQFIWVKNIEPGLPLFLFNFSDRRLHGIYESASPGQMNIDPYAWTDEGKERTCFPAQVRIRIRKQCNPLYEQQLFQVIMDNYYGPQHFWFELDHAQTEGLLALFQPCAAYGVPLASAPVLSMTNLVSGEIAQSNLSSTDPYQDGQIQRFHGVSNEKPINAAKAGDLREPFPFQSTFLSENNLHGSSGDGPHMGGAGQTLVTHQSDGNSFRKVLQKLQYLQMERENSSSKCCIDDRDVSGDLHKERLPTTEHFALVEEKRTALNPSAEVHENKFPKTSFSLVKECENPMPSHLNHGNDELVQTVRELKEKTVALEKKQLNSDLEIQHLRNAVMESGKSVEGLKCYIKELESKLSLDGVTSNKLDGHFLDSEKAIYLIGGFNGTTWLSALDSFSPSVNMIKPLNSMSCARSYASAAALNGKFYVFGGGDGSSWFDSVECYSPNEDDWTSCPSLIRPKGSLAGATSSGKIFAIGGGDGYGSFSDVEMLDPALGKWINAGQMFQKRFATAAAELHGVLYAVGGYDGTSYLQSAERYDLRVGYWTKLPNMITRRGCHSLAVFNEKLYAVGGFDGEKIVSSVEVFDPRAGTWMMDEPLTFPRGYSAAAVLDDSIFVIGGVRDGNNILNSVECYKEGSGWTVTGSEAVGARCFLSAIVL